MTVRISEYYDIFNAKIRIGDNNKPNQQATQLEAKESNYNSVTNDGPNMNGTMVPNTNGFQGFSNWSDFAAANPNNTVEITGKHKAPQAITNIDILENGDIICYPPNVSVPYWNKIIFRNYDYQVKTDTLSLADTDNHYSDWIKAQADNYIVPPMDSTDASGWLPIPEEYWLFNDTLGIHPEPWKNKDYTNLAGCTAKLYTSTSIPIFLKFDQYPSRSKVIFSSADKTRNPDIEYRFGYQHGQMSPIKLNLAPSCNNPMTTTENTTHYNYNHNFTRTDIEKILSKCYWSIEWVYERESGN